MNSVEQQDAQRIALVATLATEIYVVREKGLGARTVAKACVLAAMEIIKLAEQAVRTPTGDA